MKESMSGILMQQIGTMIQRLSAKSAWRKASIYAAWMMKTERTGSKTEFGSAPYAKMNCPVIVVISVVSVII